MKKYKKIATAVVATLMAGTMVTSLAACGPSGGGLSDTDARGYTNLRVSIGYNNLQTGITYQGTNEKDSNGARFGGQLATTGSLKVAWKGLSDKLKINFVDVYKGDSAGANISTIKNGSYKLSGVAVFTASTAAAIEESSTGALLDINTVLDQLPNYKAFLEANPVVWASLVTDADTGSMYYLPYFDGNNDIEKYVLLRKDIVEVLLNGNAELTGSISYAQQAENKSGDYPVNGESASVTAFMGSTGSYEIDVTDPASLTQTGDLAWGSDKYEVSNNNTVKVTVSYAKVIEALQNTNSDLYKAIDAAKTALNIQDAIPTDKGNIVDIQNYLINGSEGAVTGNQLVKVLRAYIDTAYLGSDGNSFYVESKGLDRASVFNSACAAWDVDLYVALGRCYVTTTASLGLKATSDEQYEEVDEDGNGTGEMKGVVLKNYLLGGRQATSQRMSDMYSLAGELFGVRGLESRYNFNYIDKAGELHDARADEASWNAVNLINRMVKEGLVYNGETIASQVSTPVGAKNNQAIFLSIHDYVQTQTLYGFSAKEEEGYNFSPVLTPVSKWNDGDGQKYMRFTESWRGVKDGGLCISAGYYKNGSQKVKDAILSFIDYCYSKDGQILMTYGTQADANTNDATKSGTWYGKAVAGPVEGVTLDKDANGAYTAETLEALVDAGVIATHDEGKSYYVTDDYVADYFMYDNVLYTGTYYNGRQIPTMTDANLSTFHSVGKNSFTNYARYYLGTTLPCFEKDQGFEYQCTHACGQVGSDIVAIALKNGTVKHQYQTLDGTTGELDAQGNPIYAGNGSASDPNYWYTLATTYLPYDAVEIASHTSTYQFLTGVGVSKAANNFASYGFNISGDTDLNLYDYVMFYGYNGTVSLHNEKYVSPFDRVPASASAIINNLKSNTYHLNEWIELKQDAWGRLLDWYNG